MFIFLTFFLTVSACKDEPKGGEDEYVAPDLTEALGEGEVRAGAIVDEASLFGGVSAEGRVGDFILYNSQARFIVQGLREGDYLIQQSSGVVDADIVRPAGQPGRDLVDEWAGMFGLGRLLDGQTVSVLDDGVESGQAVICVEGPEAPLELLTGTLESPDFIPDTGMWIRTEYTLEADTPLLKVVTTITATTEDLSFDPGDILIGATDRGHAWNPTTGLDEPDYALPWTGFVGTHNDIALAIMAPPNEFLELPPSVALLQELTDMNVGFAAPMAIAEGESASFTRYYGVGRDLATLTDAREALLGSSNRTTAQGTITASDGPVAGARVNVLVEDELYTMAVTDADGNFSATVPSDLDVTVIADGRGDGKYIQHPEGYGSYSTYAVEAARELSLDSLVQGAEPVPYARGRGVSTSSDPFTLSAPALLTLEATDGLPFAAWLVRLDEEPVVDSRLAQDRPSGGYTALAWSRSASYTIEVEPGEYRLIAHRGQRFEVHEEDISLAEGGALTVPFSLPQAYELDGWILADPHVHAGPSNDASIPLEDRAVVMAALGVQLLIGTDHDNITDYRPIVEAAGLDDVMRAVVADEVSPPLRGHVNSYPLVLDTSLPNAGAFLWWRDIPPDTQTWFDWMRERQPDALYQMNHPLDSGVAELAKWSPGVIGAPERWTEDFDAVEVLNDGEYEEYLEFYLDVFNRGVLSAPVGVSDSHTHTSGDPGVNGTFVHTGGGIADYHEADFVAAMKARETVVSLGPWIQSSVTPGSTVTGTTTVAVQAMAPSWIVVDELALWRDGVEIEVVAGTEAVFDLSPDADASYVIIARGLTPMAPIYGVAPWAMTSPILVDLDGDGWTPPLPALILED